MAKKALILHCWYGHPEDNWYPWLQSELKKKGYEVWVPKLPTLDTDSPDMEAMIKLILDTGFVDTETIIIGHSLGAVLTLRLAERIKFKMGVLVAGWDYNDLSKEHQSFWPNMLDHQLIVSNVSRWYAVISENDPYMTSFQTQEMMKRLSGEWTMVGKKGHFLAKDDKVVEIPELLKYFD
jgi:predicted alpha/beta hydrolase family esterase